MALVITSEELRLEAAAEQTDEALAMLMRISGKGMDDLLVTDCNKDRFGYDPVTGTPIEGLQVGKVRYLCYPFRWILPEQKAGEESSVTITIDNIHRDLVPIIRSQREALNFECKVVRMSAPTARPEFELNDIKLIKVGYDIFSIQGTLAMDTYLHRVFTHEKFYPARFPAMFKGIA